ncbi:DUF2188 domain-containing protein [Cupriavidus sp. SK-4]|uniref:DUF2188 domain-containing protein n=1 Tax=Cupriavidus sp. SK-4 TaxID=574750 RepID=UPI000A00EE59|nr:DUF2188 domain-containing protein [Cupriavidus sp. SK-4]
MPGRNIHVVRIEGLQWVVEIEDGSTDRQFFPSREAAIDAGTAMAQQEKADLIVHGRDGLIRRRKCFGDAPRGSKRRVVAGRLPLAPALS